jgi:vitamin B12 transporter
MTPPSARHHLLIVSCVAAAAAPVTAQRADSTELPRVVVTATRVDTPLGSRLASVTSLSGDELRKTGVQDVADALRLVPGVIVARSGGAGAQTSIFLRGAESDYVRVLVDGVPMNDPGGSIDLAHFPVDDVERIEVVRGPVSVLYGTDAVAGVVQIFTRGASEARGGPSADGGVRTGSRGALGGDASLGIGARGAHGTITAAASRSDGALPFNNEFRSEVAAARFSARATGGARVAIAARLTDDVFHYPTDGAGAVVDRNAYRSDRRESLSLEAEQPLGSRLKAVVSLAGLDGSGRTDDAPDDAVDTLGFFLYRSAGSLRRRAADARLQLTITPTAVASLGAEWGSEAQRNTDTSSFGGPRSRFAAERSNRAVYAQLLGERGRFSYVVGGRYDDNESFGVFRTARVAAAMQTWTGATVRASLGSAFKAPTFLETFSSAFSTGNPALRPERARSWEVWAEQVVAPARLTFTAAWFQQRFHDLIQYTFQPDPQAPNYFNVAGASSRGLELEAVARPVTGVSARASTTLLRTRVEDAGFDTGDGATFVQGRRLLRRPSVSSAVGVQVTRWPRVVIDAAVSHVGERDDRDFSTFPATPVTLDGYMRVDAAASVQLGEANGAGVSSNLILRADNLLGERYEDVHAFAAPRRIITVGLRLERGARVVSETSPTRARMVSAKSPTSLSVPLSGDGRARRLP